MSLKDVRILVVDDQQEVARALTRPLRRTGASLSFVANGTEGLARACSGGNDMLIIDMKMPPGEWGGLWLLEQLQEKGFSLPCIVLSGEGQKRQLIEAHRRGMTDWIDKGSADIELVERCGHIWEAASAAAIGKLLASGPSPLAFPYARYSRTIGSERQLDEALRTLAEVTRFSALIGLATNDAAMFGPLRGVQAGSFSRPSFGTWVSTLAALFAVRETNLLFRSLANQVMADDRKRWGEVVKLRNDTIGHGSSAASSAQAQMVINLVTRCAHRIATAPPIRIGSHPSMNYDGSNYHVTLRDYRGVLPPVRSEMVTRTPLRKTSVYAIADAEQHDLGAWFCALESNSGSWSLGIFDTVVSRRDGPRDEDVLLYGDVATGKRDHRHLDHDATWSEISVWFGD